jgi:hypothetical protein
MNETMALMLAALGGELLLLLLILLTVSYLRNRTARRRDHEAIQALVARVRQAKPEREQAIEQFLSRGMGLTGETLTEVKVGMLRAELVLLQRFAGIYKKRDTAAAGRFDGDLYAALAPYHALTAGGVVIEQGVEDAPATAELEFLRSENARMAEELRITMETMSRMLNEYSAMFAGAPPDHAPPIAAIAGAAGNEGEPDPQTEDVGDVQHVDIAVDIGEGEPAADGTLEAPQERAESPADGVAEQDENASEVHQPAQAPTAQRDPAQTAGPLEEGTVEVVAFDERPEAGFDPDDLADDLVDALAQQATEGEAVPRGDDPVGADPYAPDLDALFDAGDEPLKTQSGG